MKKSSFIAMVLGAISARFLGIGMCMAMLPEWNAFRPGIVVGCIGIAFALITCIVWRRMENKAPIKITAKSILTILLGNIGALALGVGMCLAMVWGSFIPGIFVGVVGITLLLCLIPVCKGIH